MRRSDVERAAFSAAGATSGAVDHMTDLLVQRIRSLLRCEAKSERIMGGDRGEGVGSLD
jgi:hypothetical protein